MTTAPSRRTRALLFAINLLFWTAIAVLFAVPSVVTGGPNSPFGPAFLYSLALLAPCMLATPLIASLATRFHFAPGQRLRSLAAHVAGATTFIVVGGAMMGVTERFMAFNARGSYTAAAAKGMTLYIASDFLIYLVVAAAVVAFHYARESGEKAAAASRLQGQLAEARLHALSAQLQPHFLFNTLHAISALVREDPSRAERLLARLSDLLRDSLRDFSQPETIVEQEFGFLEKYVEVQEARFGPRLHVKFSVDPDVLDARVPRLILQPLVENAIRHGIAPRAGPGTIDVSAERVGVSVRLTVRDDGLGVPAELREGVGLRTTRARLEQLYGGLHEFAISPDPAGGTRCTVVLPLRRTADHQA